MKKFILLILILTTFVYVSYSQVAEMRTDTLSFVKNDSLLIPVDSQQIVTEKIPLAELEVREFITVGPVAW
jgi:hypothetical protein